MSRTLLSLAGFQVIISGRFWVIAEALAGGGAFVFVGLWFMHYSDHFAWGVLLILLGLCIFVYGLNGIFNVMEINTQ